MINEFINLGKSVDFEGIVHYDDELYRSRIDFAKKHLSRTKEECFGCTEYVEKPDRGRHLGHAGGQLPSHVSGAQLRIAKSNGAG